MYYVLVRDDNDLLDLKSVQLKQHYKNMNNIVYIDEIPFIYENDYLEALKSIAADFKPSYFSNNLTQRLKSHNLYVDKYRFIEIVLERINNYNPMYIHGLTFIFHNIVFSLDLNLTMSEYIIPIDKDLKLYCEKYKSNNSVSIEEFPEGLITQWVDLWLQYSTFTIKDICDDIVNTNF